MRLASRKLRAMISPRRRKHARAAAEKPLSRPKYQPTPTPAAPPGGVRASTFKLLLDTAMALIQEEGHVPSIAEVAERSNVSRATAYRYFPSRSALVASVVDHSLGP